MIKVELQSTKEPVHTVSFESKDGDPSSLLELDNLYSALGPSAIAGGYVGSKKFILTFRDYKTFPVDIKKENT